MASKRKSTTPCMVRTSQVVEQGVLEEADRAKDKGTGMPQSNVTKDNWATEPENSSKENEVVELKPMGESQSKKLQGGYECKYCPYSTQNLNEFTEHVDMQHPNVILNPLYVCAECNFTTKKYDSLSDHNSKFHPGEANFKLKLIKRNNQTVLEQSIEATNHVSIAASGPGSGDNDPGVPVGKTPVMKTGKLKGDAKKVPKKPDEAAPDNHMEGTARLVTDTAEILSRLGSVELLQDSLGHVMPSVQLPPNINLVPKVPVPLNTTKYNSALDTNATMINSFNKFPYPTQAELSWLTAASRHPEEHIRIWFATQRLKHGISWSPEEVEEARKKMFNGTIQSVPPTITVLPAQLAPTKVSQPILQTALPCQILGQPSLVLTQVTSGPTTVSCSPITLAVAGVTNHGQKRPLVTPQAAPEPKRPHITQVPEPPPKVANTPLSTPASDRKKTKLQIAHLKASFLQSQFPDDAEVYRLIEVTGLARSEIKKWFSDHRYRCQRGIVHITSESLAKDQMAITGNRHGRTYHIYPDFGPQKFKEKSQGQLKTLEDSFLKSSFPTQAEVERLRVDTKLSRREIDSWFSERRKLRDTMEQAVLDSMGPGKKGSDGVAPNGALSRLDQLSGGQLAGSLPSPSSAIIQNQEQIHLLRSTFARTQWPTPQEYDQLAAKTGLVRTEIVRWFKENRCLLKTGTLSWLEQYQRHHLADDHGHDAVSRRVVKQVAESPKNGSEVAHQYAKDPKALCEENSEKLVPRVKAGGEQAKDCLAGKPSEATSDRSEGSSRDGQGSEENEESSIVDFVEVTVGEEDAISEKWGSWSQRVAEGTAERADSDSDSTPAEAGQA